MRAWAAVLVATGACAPQLPPPGPDAPADVPAAHVPPPPATQPTSAPDVPPPVAGSPAPEPPDLVDLPATAPDAGTLPAPPDAGAAAATDAAAPATDPTSCAPTVAVPPSFELVYGAPVDCVGTCGGHPAVCDQPHPAPEPVFVPHGRALVFRRDLPVAVSAPGSTCGIAVTGAGCVEFRRGWSESGPVELGPPTTGWRALVVGAAGSDAAEPCPVTCAAALP